MRITNTHLKKIVNLKKPFLIEQRFGIPYSVPFFFRPCKFRFSKSPTVPPKRNFSPRRSRFSWRFSFSSRSIHSRGPWFRKSNLKPVPFSGPICSSRKTLLFRAGPKARYSNIAKPIRPRVPSGFHFPRHFSIPRGKPLSSALLELSPDSRITGISASVLRMGANSRRLFKMFRPHRDISPMPRSPHGFRPAGNWIFFVGNCVRTAKYWSLPNQASPSAKKAEAFSFRMKRPCHCPKFPRFRERIFRY